MHCSPVTHPVCTPHPGLLISRCEWKHDKHWLMTRADPSPSRQAPSRTPPVLVGIGCSKLQCLCTLFFSRCRPLVHPNFTQASAQSAYGFTLLLTELAGQYCRGTRPLFSPILTLTLFSMCRAGDGFGGPRPAAVLLPGRHRTRMGLPQRPADTAVRPCCIALLSVYH